MRDSARSQRTVLILEDSAEDAATFRRYLERERDVAYICHVLSTAAAGLEVCRSLRPDVILLDYRLPDATGLAFLTALIAEHGPLAFAVVMITGVGNEAVAVQALKLGAHDYLVKEYDIQQRLIHAVASAIGKVELQRQVEQQRRDLVASNQLLLRSETQFKTLIENAPDIIARFDRQQHHLYVSPTIERVTGLPQSMFIGKTNRELGLPDHLCELWEQRLRSVFETGRTESLEFGYDSPEGMLYYQSTLIPELSADHIVNTVMSVGRDITAYKQAEERLSFLADASKALTTSLDYRITLEHITRLAIPYLGDACIIELADGNEIIDTLVAHIDPQQEELLREICRAYGPTLNSTHPAAQVLRTRQSIVVSQVSQALIDQNIVSAAHRELLQRIPSQSGMMVPLIVRDQVIGVISLYAMQVPRQYSADDREMLEELARRAAIALDNAQLYQEAQEAIREREAFLSIASHEVKNPLTTLLGRSQLLQRRLKSKGDRPRDLADIGIIIESARRINQLLTDLLDVSRVTRGQLNVDLVPLNISTLIHQVVAHIRPSAHNHRISITEPPTMLEIAGDAGRLEQVFQNLIVNAIKYSPAGGAITIDITAQDPYARISVRDEGLGIAAAALPHLFKRFYRVSDASNQQITGSGIGLYVVKEIVAGHGGTVDVSSTEGAGSTFTVYLPLAAADSRSV